MRKQTDTAPTPIVDACLTEIGERLLLYFMYAHNLLCIFPLKNASLSSVASWCPVWLPATLPRAPFVAHTRSTSEDCVVHLTHFYTSLNAGGATFAAKSARGGIYKAQNMHGSFFVLIVSHLECETKPTKQIVIAQKGMNVAQ